MVTHRVVVVVVACIVAARAAEAAPRWCRDYASQERADPEDVKHALDDYGGRPQNARFIIKAAAFACTAGGDERRILAAWQKETGLDEAGAVASLAARISPGWSADHDALCKRLQVPDGDKTDATARADARYRLFACDTDDDIDADWMIKPARLPDVAGLLDRGVLDADHDELVRLAWVMGEVREMLDPTASPRVLAQYAVAQFDIRGLSDAAALKQLDAAPYRGSLYARTIASETIAHTRAQIARLDAAVAAKTRDPAWRDAIITAPQAAAAAWQAAAARRKDMMMHGGSDGRCSALTTDVVSLMKPLAAKTADIAVIESNLREDPIAGLIIWRWAHCVADEGNEILDDVSTFSQNVPPVPGPRAAAFHAALLAAAAKKHPLFDIHDIDEPEPMHWGEEGGMGPNKMLAGVIKAMKPSKRGTALTFRSDKFTYMARECKDTKQIDWIDDHGHVHYRQACHDAGMAVGDNAPGPTTILASCTAGLAPGRFVWLHEHTPWLVFADKSARKLVAAYCLPLQ